METATVDLIETLRGERGASDTSLVLAALVRDLMAECRARLAAEDAAGELVRDGQVAELGVVEQLAVD